MKILIAWEFGDNFGHIIPCLAIALELRARGHDVVFAVCNTHTAEEVIGPHGFKYVQAPQTPRNRTSKGAPPNFSGILVSLGLANVPTLTGVVQSWLSLFELVKPDVVVLDYAPVALLATRIARIKSITVGNGFFLPPDVDPLPCILPWKRHDDSQLRLLDRQLLTAFNEVLSEMKAPNVESIPKMYLSAPTILTTFPELDHYGARENKVEVTYVGPLELPATGKVVAWPSSSARKILTCLRPSIVGARELLDALVREPAITIGAMPGFSTNDCVQYSAPNLRLYSDFIQIKPLLAKASLMATYSGAGLLAQSLLAGVPLLLMPNTSEHYLGAKRVEALGAGIVMGMDRSVSAFTSALTRLREIPAFASAARTFARAHSDYDADTALRKVADAVLLAGH